MSNGRLFALVVLVLWGLITHASYAGTGDEPHYMMVAYSLAFDRDLDLTSDYQNPANRGLRDVKAEAHVQPGKDGRMRPVHDIGMPALFAPYYLVAYKATEGIVKYVPEGWLRRARLNFTVTLRHSLSLAMIAITALMGVSLFTTFQTLQDGSTRAFGWAALLILSPPILSHSFLFFTEILSAFIALRVFMWLRDTPTGRFASFLAGAAVGYLFLVHARNAGLVAALVAIAVYRSRRWPNRSPLLTSFAVGVVLLLAIRSLVTYHFWGTWLTTPHARFEAAGWQALGSESATRIAGWLFDQEHGLLFYAPIYVLAPAGWRWLWRRQRELCLEISLIVIGYVAVMTVPMLNPHGWRGGWTPAARFLVPVAPFLAILVFASVAKRPRIPIVVWALVVVQVGLDAILWQRPGLLWNDGIGKSALLNYLDRGSGALASNLPSLLPPITAGTMIAIAVTVAASLLVTIMLTRTYVERR